jgi:prophage DNA circulation protein
METSMNRLVKLGIAAALIAGAASGAALAEDTKAKPAANAAVGATTDVTTTASIGANYGQLISGLQTFKAPDLAAFTSSSTVECVKVSSLKAEGNNNAQALDNAIDKNQTMLSSWQTGLESKTDLLGKIKTSCGLSADVEVEDILFIESGANNQFIVYFDDRA